MNDNICKNAWKFTFKAICAGFLALILLSAFVLIYNNSGIHIDNPMGFTDYKWNSAQFRSTMVEGFAWYKADYNGFNNLDSNLYSSAEILLMGSSHMEAFNIGQDKNVASLLNKRLNSQTYNIGISGHNIYTCVKNLNKAFTVFPTAKIFVLETSTIKLDINIMQSVVNNSLSKIPSYDKGLLYHIQKIPSIKVLYKQLSELIKPVSVNNPKNSVSDEVNDMEEYIANLNSFLKFMADSVEGKDLVILYHPSLFISADGTAYTDTDEYYLTAFSNACKANGITFIDMEKDFLEGYEKYHVLPHGFINTSVGKGHLNEYGHCMIAEELVNLLTGYDEVKK
jgi:hypothetical protein